MEIGDAIFKKSAIGGAYCLVPKSSFLAILAPRGLSFVKQRMFCNHISTGNSNYGPTWPQFPQNSEWSVTTSVVEIPRSAHILGFMRPSTFERNSKAFHL